jgi:hypothetical protein
MANRFTRRMQILEQHHGVAYRQELADEAEAAAAAAALDAEIAAAEKEAARLRQELREAGLDTWGSTLPRL